MARCSLWEVNGLPGRFTSSQISTEGSPRRSHLTEPPDRRPVSARGPTTPRSHLWLYLRADGPGQPQGVKQAGGRGALRPSLEIPVPLMLPVVGQVAACAP